MVDRGLRPWAWASVAGLLILAGCLRAYAIDCAATDEQWLTRNTTCGLECRTDTYRALTGLYEAYGFDPAASRAANMSDGEAWDATTACRPCLIDPLNRLTGQMATWMPDASPSLRADGLHVPSYCCWPGSVCCTEARRVQGPMTPSCDDFNVVAITLAYSNISSPFQVGLPYLQSLNTWGLASINMANNNLMGPVPASIATLDGLHELSLSANCGWLGAPPGGREEGGCWGLGIACVGAGGAAGMRAGKGGGAWSAAACKVPTPAAAASQHGSRQAWLP